MRTPDIKNPLKLFAPAPASPNLAMAGGGSMFFASNSGGSGRRGGDDVPEYEFDDDYPDEQPEETPPQRRPRSTRTTRQSAAPVNSGGRPRSASYQPEERYWTDYLRIALPVIGLLLLIGLLWYWATNIINDDNGGTEPTQTAGQVANASPTLPARSTEPADNGGIQMPQIPGASTPDVNTSGGATQAPTKPATEPTAPAGDDQSGAETPESSGGEFASGDVVVTTESVNLRSGPSTEGDPVATVPAGTQLTIVSGPEEAEGYQWYKVIREDGSSAYIASDFIEAAPE